MFRYSHKSIATTLGIAIVSTGMFASVSTYAQNGMPGTTKIPNPVASPMPSMPKIPTTPTKIPAAGTMTQPGTTTMPDGTSTPPDAKTPGSMTNPATKSTQTRTIVDLVGKSKSFTKLAAALKAADLLETLAGEGPYTVFAPTDAAFAKLPKGTLTQLLKPENKEKLQKLLFQELSFFLWLSWSVTVANY